MSKEMMRIVWLSSSLVSPFRSHEVWTIHAWLMLSSPNACLIIVRASDALFRDL
jgi:hypothetical protein